MAIFEMIKNMFIFEMIIDKILKLQAEQLFLIVTGSVPRAPPAAVENLLEYFKETC